MLNHLMITFLILLVSSCEFTGQSYRERRGLAAKQTQVDGVALSAAKREKLFELTRVYLLNDLGKEVLREAFAGSLNFHKELKEQEIKAPKSVDELLTEGNLLRLLEENKPFRNLLKNYAKDVLKNKKSMSAHFLDSFEKLDRKYGLRDRASELNPQAPHILLDKDGKSSTRFLEVYTNHQMITDNGKVIKPTDIYHKTREFIRSLEGDILANVYDFDLLGLADDFVQKAKEGAKVIVGIDQQVYHKKGEVRRVVHRLRSGGVKVILVGGYGLNHQKIIAGGIGKPGKGKLIFGSGNFTASCIHPAGDFGESGLDHKLSYPNANHYLEIHDDQLLALVKHELTKTLKLKTPVDQYPLASSYKLFGESIRGYGVTSMTVAFTPNGGLSNIMSNLLAPEIISREGPFHMATFAYPNGESHDAVFKRAQKEMQKNGKFDVLSIGDSLFSTREWAAPLEMIGHQVEHLEDTGVKLYKPNFENRWLKALGREEMRRMMGNIYAAPFQYGRHEVDVDGELHEVEAKLHHKIKVLDKNTAVIGNSANFSKSAVSRNHEQFLMVEHPIIADKARGIVRGLVHESDQTLFKLISNRNRVKTKIDKKIRSILSELKKLITSSKEEIAQIDKLAQELESEVGFEAARKIILNANKELSLPRSGSEQIAFSFDLDDNIFKVGTEIIVYHKETGEEKTLSTSLWRRYKREIGVKGKWKDYEVRSNSFANFKDAHRLVEDLVWAIDNKPTRWQGPVFERFVEAMSTEESAANTTIITARGSREGVYSALRILKDKGYIKNLPPMTHIWCMSDPNLRDHLQEAFGTSLRLGKMMDVSGNKAKVMKAVLDVVNKKRITKKSSYITDADQGEAKQMLLWTYSDDDIDNFRAAAEMLQGDIDKGRWPNVKVGLYYTGPVVEGMTDRQVILRQGEPPRRFTIREELEWIQIKYGSQTGGTVCEETLKSFVK